MSMTYNPEKHHRRSIRLRGYDYSQPGAYFITICTQHRLCLFGEVVNGEMVLNAAGQMVWYWWLELNHKFPNVETDAAVVMPNHFHGILLFHEPAGATPSAHPETGGDDDTARHAGSGAGHETKDRGELDEGHPHGGAPSVHAPTLGEVVGWFGTMTTNAYIRGVKQHGWRRFPGKLWQRNYWDRILRDEEELNRVRGYIGSNPANWHEDENNPDHRR